MLLTASEITVTYGSSTGDPLTAIKDVELNIAAGEFVSVIGPSGCGKSTLLHCLGGLISPTAGRIAVRDEEIRTPDPRLAAFVFQDYTLLPWKVVADNVALGLRWARMDRERRQVKSLEMLELVGLSDFAKSYPRELSGGMQQRVAVARAMSMDPEILLMDEPFGALDEQTRRHLGNEMSRILTEAGRTLVMVTHSLDEAIFWGDRIVVLSARPGQIVREISVNEARPRRLDFVASPEFASIRTELFELLESAEERASASVERSPELMTHEPVPARKP